MVCSLVAAWADLTVEKLENPRVDKLVENLVASKAWTKVVC
jgi:hypothetical protein